MNISFSDNLPIYEQIKNHIKNDILNGKLKSGEALPSIRVLAKNLKISVITTKRAYDDLEKEHYIVSRVGKGSFVAEQKNDFIKEKRRNAIEKDIENLMEKAKIYNISKEELIRYIQEL